MGRFFFQAARPDAATVAAVALATALPGTLHAGPLSAEELRGIAGQIDRLVERDLQRDGLEPMPLADDPTFLRRAYLGIVGRIPTEAEAREFLESTGGGSGAGGDEDDKRRSRLIDQLTASPGFDSHLFNWTADLLRVQTNNQKHGLGWHVWLRRSLAEDKPWNQLVNEMLSAEGHCVDDPAVGYYLRDRNMQLDNFSNSMQVFLGRQIGCAQCHDHPFDDWSQFDYYQMAAFTGGFNYRSRDADEKLHRLAVDTLPDAPPARAVTERNQPRPGKQEQAQRKRKLQQQRNRNIQQAKRKFRPLFNEFHRNALVDDPRRKLKLPEDYQYPDAEPESAVAPETRFGPRVGGVAAEDRRASFADWVTHRENPYFAKVIANRLWRRTFGHGLHEPVDDWKEDSEPAHPEVLALLEKAMRDVDYDLRQFQRILFHTRIFQRQSDPGEPAMGVAAPVRGPTLRRMSAEQLFDSFLVLRSGDGCDEPTLRHAHRWQHHCEEVHLMLEASTEELVEVSKEVKQADKALRKAQSDLREAQRSLAEATEPEQRKAIRGDIEELRKRVQSLRRERDPLQAFASPDRDRKRENNNRLRASEHPAPFRPGTLVREFGGSDRQTSASRHTTATIPQALALLNDPKTDVIAHSKTRLARQLTKLESPSARLDLLFHTLYARPPSADEAERFGPLTEDPTALRDLTRAMLTSNEFLFIR